LSRDGLPTPRSTLRDSSACVLVWCKSCRHQADADLQQLVNTGRGDVPLIHLRYRCSKCRSRLTDRVCTSRYGGRSYLGVLTHRAIAPVSASALDRDGMKVSQPINPLVRPEPLYASAPCRTRTSLPDHHREEHKHAHQADQRRHCVWGRLKRSSALPS
jgi:hypothetical protein